MSKQSISIPYDWAPRPYQMNLWNHLANGGDRAVAIWHRRAGKDDVALNWAARSAVTRIGNYWHMLPEASQARKAVWDAVDPHTGKRRIDRCFPLAIRKATRANEMLIEFINGSTWQVVGSDNFNSLVGSPPIGCVFSEWALADPSSWAYIRPILAENGGWAVFITTPRGRNHAATFYDMAATSPDWFAELLPATRTDVFSEKALARERAEYIAQYGDDVGQSRFDQEYLCSFDAAVVGAYYGSELSRARSEERITQVPYEPSLPVTLAWDLGLNDMTAIWFIQKVGQEIRAIDYKTWRDKSLVDITHEILRMEYHITHNILPHDVRVREMTTGKSRLEVLVGLGLRGIDICPQLPILDGINAGRLLLRRAWFDEERCKDGIAALGSYHRQFDEKLQNYRDAPVHDWASHGADAWRYLALQWSERAGPGDPTYVPPATVRQLGGKTVRSATRTGSARLPALRRSARRNGGMHLV